MRIEITTGDGTVQVFDDVTEVKADDEVVAAAPTPESEPANANAAGDVGGTVTVTDPTVAPVVTDPTSSVPSSTPQDGSPATGSPVGSGSTTTDADTPPEDPTPETGGATTSNENDTPGTGGGSDSTTPPETTAQLADDLKADVDALVQEFPDSPAAQDAEAKANELKADLDSAA